jgi:hypothetical protein
VTCVCFRHLTAVHGATCYQYLKIYIGILGQISLQISIFEKFDVANGINVQFASYSNRTCQSEMHIGTDLMKYVQESNSLFYIMLKRDSNITDALLIN